MELAATDIDSDTADAIGTERFAERLDVFDNCEERIDDGEIEGSETEPESFDGEESESEAQIEMLEVFKFGDVVSFVFAFEAEGSDEEDDDEEELKRELVFEESHWTTLIEVGFEYGLGFGSKANEEEVWSEFKPYDEDEEPDASGDDMELKLELELEVVEVNGWVWGCDGEPMFVNDSGCDANEHVFISSLPSFTSSDIVFLIVSGTIVVVCGCGCNSDWPPMTSFDEETTSLVPLILMNK